MARRRSRSARGKIVAHVVEKTGEQTLASRVRHRVVPETRVYTDEHRAYQNLGDMGYQHGYVTHAAKVYVAGDVHTNTVEGFWSLLKRGIVGVYHGVGEGYLQSYIDEYVFRYNTRDAIGRGVFEALISRIGKASPQASS